MSTRRCARSASALLLGVFALSTAAADESRFSGGGSLRENAANDSDDGRFRLRADLGRGDAIVGSGRFALDATLSPSAMAKSVAAATNCSELFLNGFEG